MRNEFDITSHDQEGYLFITGTPRVGTLFIAHAFQAIGIDIQHEQYGEQGISAFHIVPYLAQRKHGIIYHQVRDTLKTISSMQTIHENSWRLIFNYTGITPEQGGLIHAVMRLYLRLNLHIEKFCDFRYQVEAIDTVWSQMLNLAKIPDQPLPAIPTDTHTRRDRFKQLKWGELEFRDAELTEQIKAMSNRYGYEVKS